MREGSRCRWRSTETGPCSSARGQLSLSAVEAGIGVVFVLAVVASFGVALPETGTHEAQLDAYADDSITVLSSEPPRHGGVTRLSEVSSSPSAFERESASLERRVRRIVPENVLFRLRTPHGSVGFRKPTGVPVGQATTTTVNGDVTIWVWYA